MLLAPVIDIQMPTQDASAMIAIVAFLAVTVINFGLLTFWGIRRLWLEIPTFRSTWSYLDPWLVIQLIAIQLTIGTGILFALHGKITDTEHFMTEPSVILPLLFLQNVIFYGVPAVFIFGKYLMPLREIGLPPLPRRKDVLLGIGLGLAAILISLPVEAGLTKLAHHFEYIPWVARGLKMDESQPIQAVIDSMTKRGPWILILAFLAIGPGPGFGEEMLFRGFFFNLLKKRLGLWPGIVLSGLIFSAVHGYFIGFLPVFLLGMALAYTYHRTGSLWTSILFHATNNGVLVLLAYFFPSLAH